MNYNIILCGVCDVDGSTNISMAKAFIRLGFSVIPINYRTILNKYGMEILEDLLIDTIKKYNPIVTIFCKCNNVDPEIIKKCTELTTTWLWNPDPYQTLINCPEVIEHAKNCTFSSCTGGGVAQWLTDQINKTCYHIFDGVDLDIFKPVNIENKYIADISFIGGKTTERDYFKDVLENEDLIVKFYGNGYENEVINKEFAKVCSSSKLMLSLNTFNDIPDYFSNRLFRYMGCGSCVLHLDRTETLNKFFNNMQDLVFFKNEEELIGNINYLMNNQKEIGRIGINGRDLVLNRFTWFHSMISILEIIKREVV